MHSLDDLTTLLQIYLPRARLNIVFTAVARIITNLALNFLYLLKMIVTGRVRQLSREYIESCQGNHNEAISKQNPFSRDYDGKNFNFYLNLV